MMSVNKRENLVLESEARVLLAAPPDGDFIAALRSVLKKYQIKQSEAAELAGMSVRSLQRKLKAAGWSYSKLLEAARLELAMEMLKSEECSLNEIAKRTGYSALSNFTRAFGRWTGMSPSEFRERNRSVAKE